MTLGLLGLLVLALAVLLLGGGAEDGPRSRDSYRAELTSAFAGFDFDANPADDRALSELAGDYREVVADLDDVVPPPDAAAAHARLVGGMYDYARLLDAFVTRRGGVPGYQQFLAEIGGTPRLDWVQAFNELAARGYVQNR